MKCLTYHPLWHELAHFRKRLDEGVLRDHQAHSGQKTLDPYLEEIPYSALMTGCTVPPGV